MLQDACDRFDAYTPPAQCGPAEPLPSTQTKELLDSIAQAALMKQCERQLILAVTHLAEQSKTGLVGLGALGHHMNSTYPDFSAKKCQHAGLAAMVKALPGQLFVERKDGGDWVRPVMKENRSA